MADRPSVFVSRPIVPEARARLAASADLEVWDGGGPPSRSELIEHCRDVDGVLTMGVDRVDVEFLDACPKLKVVSNLAVGFDNVDVAELTRRHIPLGNTPGVVTNATADLALALILATSRRIFEAHDAIYAGAWTTWDPSFMLGLELAGSVLGVVGLGRIGAAVAKRAQAFDMEVIGWTRSGSSGERNGVQLVPFDTLFRRSDIVSLHVALEQSTRHLVGAREFALMKPGAILINTARGGIVDQQALTEALTSRRIGGAGLDVFAEEPIPLDDPLLKIPTCVALPHIGSATNATRRAMLDLAVDNLLAGLAGEPLPACVNPDYLNG